jgi:hypothetical protein
MGPIGGARKSAIKFTPQLKILAELVDLQQEITGRL